MAGGRRNYGIAAGLLVLLAIGASVLPSALWACVLAAVLGLAGVVLLRGNRWRTGALLATALAVSLALLDAVRRLPDTDADRAGARQDDRSEMVAAARSGPGIPPAAQQPGHRDGDVRAGDGLPPHLSFRRQRRPRDAAGPGRIRHLSVPGRLLHLRPGPARRPEPGRAVRQGERLRGAYRQPGRAGLRAQPSRARDRSGSPRSLCRPVGQGGGELDHPGTPRARHRRRLVAGLLAALRSRRTARCATPVRSTSIAGPIRWPG